MSAATSAEAPNTTRRGRPRSSSVDDRLFEAALALLAEAGYGELTLAAVAERAGVARTTLYRRWSSRSEMVVALVSTRVLTEFEYTGDVRGDLVRLMQNAADANEAFGAASTAIMAAGAADAAIARASNQYDEAHRAVVRTILEKGIANGELRDSLDVEIAIDQLGGIFPYRQLTNRPLPRNLSEEAVRNVLDGAFS